jgi:hypothetical protein
VHDLVVVGFRDVGFGQFEVLAKVVKVESQRHFRVNPGQCFNLASQKGKADAVLLETRKQRDSDTAKSKSGAVQLNHLKLLFGRSPTNPTLWAREDHKEPETTAWTKPTMSG